MQRSGVTLIPSDLRNYGDFQYTKYFSNYSNDDWAQTVLCFFRCAVIDGALHIDNQVFCFRQHPEIMRTTTRRYSERWLESANRRISVCRVGRFFAHRFGLGCWTITLIYLAPRVYEYATSLFVLSPRSSFGR